MTMAMRDAALAAAAVLVVSRGAPAEGLTLHGAGATFPAPLYERWFKEYGDLTDTRIGYKWVGSGEGIKSLLACEVDFAGTDAFMSDEDLRRAGGEIMHVPTCLGGVAVTYNLPGNPALRFTPDVLADVFLGKITRWNDARLAAVNAGTALPNLPIVVAHRSDGSGTTFIFTHYLSAVSEEWREKAGHGKRINWPVGLGAETNPRVAALVRRTEGAVGYVELIYAESERMPVAAVRNSSGVFVAPSVESVSLAADVELPDDTRVLITNTPSPGGYPMGGFTWIICYREQSYRGRSRERAEALARLLWWMVHEGQRSTGSLKYSALPPAAIGRAERLIASMTFGGRAVADWAPRPAGPASGRMRVPVEPAAPPAESEAPPGGTGSAGGRLLPAPTWAVATAAGGLVALGIGVAILLWRRAGRGRAIDGSGS
jgi:phosphate transport system substrate-binding protein